MNPSINTQQQQNFTTAPTRISITHSQQAHLEVLKNVVKVLYDDKISFEIIKYIINLNGLPAEEEKMVNDLNLKFDHVRQCLTRMGNDGLLISKEFKRKKEKDEDDSNIYLQGLQPTNQNAYIRRPGNKKINTLEWTINDTYYNIIKQRFEELKRKLENTLEYKSKDKFECPKCKRIYELHEVAHIGYVCKQCEEKPKLNEIKAEDVTLLRKYCNEVIQMLTEEFIKADKSGNGFHIIQRPVIRQHSHREKKSVNNMQLLSKGQNEISQKLEMARMNPDEIIVLNDLEDPDIQKNFELLKKDEKKMKKFKEIMEGFYMYK